MHPPDPLRLCTENGCTLKPHYENCDGCWGFGVNGAGIPVSARTVTPDRAPADARACPICGSTIEGPPEK